MALDRPAMPTGLGYEADKLSSKHMQAYFHGYIDPIAQSLGPLMGKGLQYVLMDSWEAGMQNSTDEMLGEFRKRRGYDATPYLPALAGRVVDSAEVSERFLWDFRRTLADLAFLLNEGAPSTMPIWGSGLTPAPPDGYDYDYINADVLLKRMSVGEGGRLALPDGMSYRVLVLPQTDRMRPELLQKLRELVAGGATVVGPKPLRSPSLTAYPEADGAVQTLAAELWGDLDGVSRTTRRYGKGMVIWGLPLGQILASLSVPKDFDYGRSLDANVAWLHRRSGETDIYYVANLTDRA